MTVYPIDSLPVIYLDKSKRIVLSETGIWMSVVVNAIEVTI